MSIDIADVEIGWLYRTERNQERIVLGCDKDCKIIYAVRGGNVLNPFTHRERSSMERFAAACAEKAFKLSDEAFQEVLVSANAVPAIDLNNHGCLAKNESL